MGCVIYVKYCWRNFFFFFFFFFSGVGLLPRSGRISPTIRKRESSLVKRDWTGVLKSVINLDRKGVSDDRWRQDLGVLNLAIGYSVLIRMFDRGHGHSSKNSLVGSIGTYHRYELRHICPISMAYKLNQLFQKVFIIL
jgi:hypothetical protein